MQTEKALDRADNNSVGGSIESVGFGPECGKISPNIGFSSSNANSFTFLIGTEHLALQANARWQRIGFVGSGPLFAPSRLGAGCC